LDIKKKQAIGFLDGGLVAVSDSADEVLTETLARVNPDEAEVVTIYYGADTKLAEAEQVAAAIREQHPQLQVEVVQGGQPHYNYIASVE
jgi:dihydroxyacetone kinase-like predicted kinase